jgi:hypothetical protein
MQNELELIRERSYLENQYVHFTTTNMFLR